MIEIKIQCEDKIGAYGVVSLTKLNKYGEVISVTEGKNAISFDTKNKGERILPETKKQIELKKIIIDKHI